MAAPTYTLSHRFQGTVPYGFAVPANGTLLTYDEAPDSPQESMSGQVFRSRRSFFMPWSQRWTFAAWMVGYPALQQDYLGNWWVSRNVPQGYSALDFTGTNTPFLYASSIESIQGVGKITGYDAESTAQYSTARVTVGFETLSHRVFSDGDIFSTAGQLAAALGLDSTSDTNLGVFAQGGVVGGIDEASLVRYVTRFRQPTAEYITLPFGALKWCEPNPVLTPPGSISKIVAAVELQYVWHQVPNIPLAAKQAIGTVNDQSFDGYPRGTLLLTSIDLKPYRWFFNSRVWDITYKFKFFSPVGNPDDKLLGVSQQVLDVPRNVWVDIRRDATGTPLVEYLGHNHFLRMNFSDPNGPSAVPAAGGVGPPSFLNMPTYQMISHNGNRPDGNSNSITIAGVTTRGSNAGQSNGISLGGKTVYAYTNFSNLFRPTAPLSPPE